MSIKPTPNAENLHYDREIVPSETEERLEREGENFQKTPEPAKSPEEGHIDTTTGYTVDREGLANNYAIEPEMYYEVPGDRREKQEALKQQRAEEFEALNETDEDGKLEVGEDRRSKGPGLF
ncbi:hypothetical protein [Baaleninema sp.]|uniref:hypothetical protein n=1 Tax=Baaleninema sp. TaxID=3101197 RepID=UPI003D074EB4